MTSLDIYIECLFRRQSLTLEISGIFGICFPCCLSCVDHFGHCRLALYSIIALKSTAALRAVVFDYRCNGGSERLPRGLIDWYQQQEDWKSAIRYTRLLENVDANLVGLLKTAPKRVVKWYEGMGHFEIYYGQPFEQAIQVYKRFLQEALPVTHALLNKSTSKWYSPIHKQSMQATRFSSVFQVFIETLRSPETARWE